MKFAIFSLFLSAVLLLGCTDSPISPTEPDNQSYQLIKLPPKSGMSVETVYSKTELIDGQTGGDIRIKEYYFTDNHQIVKIDAKLTIPKNAFTGSVNITMAIDDEYAAVSFGPSMVFDQPLEFDLKINGLDSSVLTSSSGSYKFIYVADNGSTEDVANDGVDLDDMLKGLTVHNAQINHFSRYAFTR
jgi:hypothetical protein